MDEEEFKVDAHNVWIFMFAFLAKWYGPRCPEFCKDCVCCQQWARMDKFLESPYEP